MPWENICTLTLSDLVQVAECRGQLLKEQKGRYALMLRKERLEAEVVRLCNSHELERRSGMAARAKSLQAEAKAHDLQVCANLV